ncbi:hypothetical protein AB0F30_36830 [Streptomyces sp. NPDC029006]|uniref:hypothetical protein n=1 Tax=Streptomyces sp. NPDC029006 TaxID=3155467 RepID=UPI0033FE1AC2
MTEHAPTEFSLEITGEPAVWTVHITGELEYSTSDDLVDAVVGQLQRHPRPRLPGPPAPAHRHPRPPHPARDARRRPGSRGGRWRHPGRRHLSGHLSPGTRPERARC